MKYCDKNATLLAISARFVIFLLELHSEISNVASWLLSQVLVVFPFLSVKSKPTRRSKQEKSREEKSAENGEKMAIELLILKTLIDSASSEKRQLLVIH